jgi:hypothetical protein
MRRVGVRQAGIEADGPSGPPRLTADGITVSFRSDATNLVPGDSNAVPDLSPIQ